MKKTTDQQQDRYFRTTSFYPAAFLLARGAALANVDKTSDSKRAHFVFTDPPMCEDLLKVFNYAKEGDGEVLVDPRKMVAAIKALKEKLYQENF